MDSFLKVTGSLYGLFTAVTLLLSLYYREPVGMALIAYGMTGTTFFLFGAILDMKEKVSEAKLTEVVLRDAGGFYILKVCITPNGEVYAPRNKNDRLITEVSARDVSTTTLGCPYFKPIKNGYQVLGADYMFAE